MPKEPDWGENSLWHLAIQNYYPRILNFVYYLTGDRYLAEDIAQETFARAIDKFHQLKDPNRMFSWLVSIAVNLVKTHHRTKQRTVAMPELAHHIPALSQDEFFIDMIERQEIQKLVQDVISQLSSQEQKIIIMRYYLDMKEKDIAFALKVTIGTVKKQLFRARSKLYNDLGCLAGGEGEEK